MKPVTALLVFLFAIIFQLNAKAFQGITFSVKNEKLEKVFKEIQKQSGFSFIFSNEDLAMAEKVTIKVVNAELKDVLEKCFAGQPLVYTVTEQLIVVRRKSDKATKAIDIDSVMVPGDISGKVTNDKGEPIVGATVTVKGTAMVTSTGTDGTFFLKGVAGRALIMVSSIGYEAKMVKLGNQSNILIQLGVAVVEMKSVTVTTGYQNISKERFVGSYSQLDSASFHRRAGMGIIDRLDGTVVGVLFNKKGDGVSPIQVRGISTLDGALRSPSSAPLIILDNFPYTQDLSTINPNDVETITVLKDAAAASIWGTRAGNGVIVITTKSGRYNQPFNVSFTSNLTITEKPDLYYYPQMASSDFIDLEKDLYGKSYYYSTINNNSTWPAVTPVVEILNRLENGLLSEEEANQQIDAFRNRDIRKDLDNYVYQAAKLQQHYINFSGGSSTLRFLFSVGYNHFLPDVQGLKADDQFTINSNIAFRPLKKLEVKTGIILNQSNNRAGSFAMPFSYPYGRLVDSDGQPEVLPYEQRIGYIDTAGGGDLLDWKYRPLDELRQVERTGVNRSATFNLGVSYNLTNWLTAQISSQITVLTGIQHTKNSAESFFARNLINRYTDLSQTNPILRNPIPVGGIMDVLNSESNSKSLRGQIIFNKTFRQLHSLNMMVSGDISEGTSSAGQQRFYGYNDETGSYNNRLDYSNQFPLYGSQGIYNYIPLVSSQAEGATNRFVSLSGNVSYTYDGRYTIYGSARRDGSNIFGANTNDKWKPLWAVGLGWDLMKERFFNVNNISTLRLKASYGYSGNVNNQLSALTTIQYSGVANYSFLPIASLVDPPNPDLKWEQVGIMNVGVDFSIYENRLSGSFEWFHKKSTDLISAVPFGPSRGVNTFAVNAASMKGNGFEANLRSRNTIGAIEWNTSLGISYAKMVVTNIFQPNFFKASDFISYGLNTSVGRVAYGISSYRWSGLDPQTGDPIGMLDGKASKSYVDIFNDSVDNQVFHGSSIPLYSGYLSNSVSWKNLTLSLNITYRLKFYFRKPSFDLGDIASGTMHKDYLIRWQKPGDELMTNVPALLYPVPPELDGRDIFYKGAEINVMRGDNIKLQDIRLQYNLNTKEKGWAFKNIQLFLYANNLNLILWRKDKSDLDPDFVGASNFSGPTPRAWTCGLTATL